MSPVRERLILLYPAQVEFLNRGEPFVAFVGGIGSGKSFVLMYDLLKRVQRHGLYMVAAPTYPMLRDATLRSFFDVAEKLGKKTYFNRAEHRVTLPNTGAEILFRSADDPEKMRGPNLAGIALDEASLMSKSAYEIAIGRLRQGGEVGFLRAAMTPKGRHHWTYDVFASGKPDTYTVRSRTADNPFLPEKFEATIRSQYTDVMIRQELEGEFLEDGTEFLFPDAWLRNAVRLAASLQGEERKAEAIGVDPGEGKADTAMCAVDKLGIVELVSKRTPDTAIVTSETLAFCHRHKVPPERVVFDLGGGGKQHADRLRQQGYNVRAVAFGESVAQEYRRWSSSHDEQRNLHTSRIAYRNRRSQMYGLVRDLLDPAGANGGFAIPGEYVELLRQLAPIPLTYDPEGRLELLPKHKREHSSKRSLVEIIGCSPDQADALALAVFAMCHQFRRPRAGAW